MNKIIYKHPSESALDYLDAECHPYLNKLPEKFIIIVKFYHMFGIPVYIIVIIFVILIFLASKRIRGIAQKLRTYEDI